jgi:hypothetical protein
MREALPAFARQVPGFAMADAVMTGVETRTSSPVRLPRDGAFQSVNTAGLFPAGEGAGYAGGILSAGVDGIRVAEAVAMSLTGRRCRPSGHAGGAKRRWCTAEAGRPPHPRTEARQRRRGACPTPSDTGRRTDP